MLDRRGQDMPIIKGEGQLGYFVHIPKCGGTSVERYMADVGLKLAMIDVSHLGRPSPYKWNKSSPQHIDAYSLSRLFPADFFDLSFAIVRNPIKRLESAFLFNRRLRKNKITAPSLNDFVHSRLAEVSKTAGAHDNHFWPQSKFVPETGCKVFRLEDGMAQVKEFIDDAFFGRPTEQEIGHKNAARRKDEPQAEILWLDDAALNIVQEVYGEDAERFGYGLAPDRFNQSGS